MLDDIDLDPADRKPPEIPSQLPDLPERLPATHNPEALGVGAFRGIFFAIPIALLLWAIIGGAIYLFL